MSDNWKSGRDGKAVINGTELAITGWNVDPRADIFRFRNSKTGLYDRKDSTHKDASFSIQVEYDFDQSPFGAPLSLDVGDEITEVRLYLDGLTGKNWYFPSALVTTTPQSLQVGGGITTTINCENDGVWTPPT